MSDIWNPLNAVFCGLVALVVNSSMLPSARAQYVQQGSKLIGLGNLIASRNFVAVSGDGNTAMLGNEADGLTGSAVVYTRSGSV